ncbi:PstS family phosphate ABC transporter substrate-binding protein [Lignipirellula cremea]|uniref:Phosphate-binding protein n=1 Tax=Lignipirellula cremea TaxID=2528010 RepID=A0A518E299_9BACT|nr:PstS family phosphate ABC transporter substrate-binding protein [Lignipirellula cremea]QDU98210.1 Phosphate-binding protein PstS precursor [Lignipirellula cremea]
MPLFGQWLQLASLLLAASLLLGCGPQPQAINIDGSSTVGPITKAIAEKFREIDPVVHITVGVSGSGGGFKKLIAGEITICNASRPIKASETAQLQAKGIEVVEIEVAYDGLAVVVHPESRINKLTVAQLKELWKTGSTIKKWSNLDPAFGDAEIDLYGPGTDSGTFDYFTEAVVGESGDSRSDYTANENDNALVNGVAGNPSSLGYFGLAYFKENASRLKLVAIDNGDGEAILPSEKTVTSGQYKPLSRPLYIYVRKDALAHPQVASFVRFYLDNASDLVKEVGYVRLSDEALEANKAKVVSAASAARTTADAKTAAVNH